MVDIYIVVCSSTATTIQSKNGCATGIDAHNFVSDVRSPLSFNSIIFCKCVPNQLSVSGTMLMTMQDTTVCFGMLRCETI